MKRHIANEHAMAGLGRDIRAMLKAGPVDVTVSEHKAKRSDEQNKRLWALLTDISRQVEWPVDGRMAKLTPEDWKHVISAGLKKHQRIAAGIEGGFVILGQRTSRMTVAEMSELQALIEAFGAQHGVQFTDPQFQSLMQSYGEAA